MNTQNKYKNKYFSILGDSISTFEGYSQPKYAEFYNQSVKYASGVITFGDTWWGNIIDTLGGELLVNNSISGSHVCGKAGACSDARTSALGTEETKPDVIMVYIGTNDWGGGARIHPENGETADERFFSFAYRTMLEKLKRYYPEAEIWCFTLGVSARRSVDDFEFQYVRYGHHIEEYCDEIRACAKEYGCRLIDLYRNAPPFDTFDGDHPNAEGMLTISEAVLRMLERG